MYVIFATAADEQARQLKAHLGADRTVLVFPRDLSIPGWTLRSDRPQDATFVGEGHRHRASGIRGCILRLPCISDHDLVYMHEQDRAYAAAEMTAFLLSWVRGASVATLNVADPLCLAGPSWEPRRWRAWAACRGLDPDAGSTRAPSSAAGAPPESAASTVTVVGESTHGDAPAPRHEFARRLARSCGANLMAVRFGHGAAADEWLGADPWADVADEGIARAIRHHFEARPA